MKPPNYLDDSQNIEAWFSLNWSGEETLRIRHFDEHIELTHDQITRLMKWYEAKQ